MCNKCQNVELFIALSNEHVSNKMSIDTLLSDVRYAHLKSKRNICAEGCLKLRDNFADLRNDEEYCFWNMKSLSMKKMPVKERIDTLQALFDFYHHRLDTVRCFEYGMEIHDLTLSYLGKIHKVPDASYVVMDDKCPNFPNCGHDFKISKFYVTFASIAAQFRRWDVVLKVSLQMVLYYDSHNDHNSLEYYSALDLFMLSLVQTRKFEVARFEARKRLAIFGDPEAELLFTYDKRNKTDIELCETSWLYYWKSVFNNFKRSKGTRQRFAKAVMVAKIYHWRAQIPRIDQGINWMSCAQHLSGCLIELYSRQDPAMQKYIEKDVPYGMFNYFTQADMYARIAKGWKGPRNEREKICSDNQSKFGMEIHTYDENGICDKLKFFAGVTFKFATCKGDFVHFYRTVSNWRFYDKVYRKWLFDDKHKKWLMNFKNSAMICMHFRHLYVVE